MTLGQWIKKERTDRGWSQEALARLLQVNRSSVAQWESGTTRPHLLRLGELAEWFGDEIPRKIVKATWGS